MKINYKNIPEYRTVANAIKGKPGAKMIKRMMRNKIKSDFRKARIMRNRGRAE